MYSASQSTSGQPKVAVIIPDKWITSTVGKTDRNGGVSWCAHYFATSYLVFGSSTIARTLVDEPVLMSAV